MKKPAGLLLLPLLLGACAPNSAPGPPPGTNTITFNDFEGGGGWSNDPGRNDPSLLDKGRAHSGQYAIKVDGAHEFSLTFDLPLIQISQKKFHRVRLDAWVYLPSAQATGALGIQVMNHAKNEQVFGDYLKLGEVVKTYKKWVPVHKDFTLPANITPVQHLRLSLWRADATDFVLADDVQLTLLD